MRRPRLKIENGIYHCISRITGGRFWIEAVGKEVWCDQLRRVSQFCGVQVLTYVVLDNHFHLLVHVPSPTPLTDGQLVERYRALYPHRPKLVQEAEATLKKGDLQAEELRRRLRVRMHDVSQFLKELKQRFTMWYNAHYKLFGTIWDGRFKSILVENDSSVLRTVAAYIDLNALRAGLVKNPERYHWCGIGAAHRGDAQARSGLAVVMKATGWAEVKARYWRFVYEAGIRQVKDQSHATVDIEKVESLSASPNLATRQQWLSEGWLVGSREFVRENLRNYLLRCDANQGVTRLTEHSIHEMTVLAGRGRGEFSATTV
jgi:REP element-mobilizing transposase RayT